MKRNSFAFLLPALLILVSSCRGIETDDPILCYQKWAHELPPRDVHVMKGHYWHSGLWAKDDEVYLIMKSERNWWSAFIYQNGLIPDSSAWIPSSGKPGWFNPPSRTKNWKNPKSNSESYYMMDSLYQIIYIHEVK